MPDHDDAPATDEEPTEHRPTPRTRSTDGPVDESDDTTQSDAGLSGDEAPPGANAHVDPDDEDEQREHGRRSRDTGGDAPAAGSVEEREALSEDRDDPFDEQR